ncbi:MAG: glycosyltransferase [Chlorobiales bacterium]|nr:glycosyltransferase [Chlorobiales bacterium]
MLIYQLFVLGCLLVFLGILLKNLLDVKALPKRLAQTPASHTPLVSILVPARNEAHNIEQCVRSLFAQTYPKIEILVLNDNSEDETGEILARLAAEDVRLNVLSGSALPDSWLGKCWACHQLSVRAQGQFLCFTDADTVHAPQSLERAIVALEQNRADLLTLLTGQVLGSFWERVIVPLVHFSVLCYLPVKFVWTKSSQAFVFANGQFMLFTRSIYERIGGHEAVKAALVEDVWLCKAVKAAGGKPMVFSGVDTVRCRMYRDLREVLHGFSKNLFAGLGYSLFAVLMVCAVSFMAYILPLGFLGYALFHSNFSIELFWLPALHLAMAILMRILIATRFKLSLPESFLHGLSMVMFIGIAFNSVRWIKSGKGALWKGRRYDFSKSQVQVSSATASPARPDLESSQ